MTSVTTGSTATDRAAMPTWLLSVIAGAFGLLYAFAVWTSVAFLVQQAGGDAGLTGYGWFVLLMPVVFPVFTYIGAFTLGWRRRAGQLVLLMLTGLCVIGVFWMNVFALAVTSDAIYNLT